MAGTLPLAAPFAGKVPLFQKKKVPVGLELYSVRDELSKDMMGTVRAVAKLGYEVVEFYSPYLSWTTQQATDVRKLLDDLGVKCLSTHNSPQAISADGIAKTIELNRIIGSHQIIVASAGRVANLDGWKAFADSLNAAADKLKPEKMSTGFHNHQTEWAAVEGTRPMDVLATRTGKDVILQLDVGTCVEVNADPVGWIKANPGRIKSIHCKDWAPGVGYATLFGEGSAPWAQIFEAAESVGGVEHYLIEQEAGPANEQLLRAEKCLANWKKMRG